VGKANRSRDVWAVFVGSDGSIESPNESVTIIRAGTIHKSDSSFAQLARGVVASSVSALSHLRGCLANFAVSDLNVEAA
jgi:hypothetical protein